MAAERSVRVGGRTVRVHRPDKVLFPDDGITKDDLVAYYRSAAPLMLPRLRGRPLMLERYPDGLGAARFMQKNIPETYPEYVRRVEVAKAGGTVTHPVCDTAAALLFLADQACLTFHGWLSRAGRLERPDRMVFDLDPPGDDFEAVRAAALLLGDLLDELELPSVVLTTGSRGVHVIVPLAGESDFDAVRAFAAGAAEVLAARAPDRLTTRVRKEGRGGRLYLDVQRNAYAQTAVAPLSVRARPGAPVATPLTWEQLREKRTTARRWTIADAVEQAAARPWGDTLSRGRRLAPAARRLAALH